MLSIRYNADIQSKYDEPPRWDNLQRKDKRVKRPVPKVSFVQRFDCTGIIVNIPSKSKAVTVVIV